MKDQYDLQERALQSQPGIAGEVDGKKFDIGTWWWDLSGIKGFARGVGHEQIMRHLKNNHVSEIYLDVTAMHADGELGDPRGASYADVQRFVARCRDLGIRVSAMTGVSRDRCRVWLNPDRHYPEIDAFIDSIAFYNAFSEPEERFTSAHIDVEPHSISDFCDNRALYYQQYALLLRYISQRLHHNGLELETDVCGDLRETDMVRIGSKEMNIIDVVFDTCDTVTVMAYRREAARQMVFGTDRYIPYAKRYNKRLVVGCETMLPCLDLAIDDIPPQITYASVGRDVMLEEMDKLQHMILDTGLEKYGIAVHHVYSWYQLFEKAAAGIE